jgi:hypothetical protein
MGPHLPRSPLCPLGAPHRGTGDDGRGTGTNGDRGGTQTGQGGRQTGGRVARSTGPGIKRAPVGGRGKGTSRVGGDLERRGGPRRPGRPLIWAPLIQGAPVVSGPPFDLFDGPPLQTTGPLGWRGPVPSWGPALCHPDRDINACVIGGTVRIPRALIILGAPPVTQGGPFAFRMAPRLFRAPTFSHAGDPAR